MGLIMRRNLMAAKSGYTAKDYVQDGLIAMWDGIENAGFAADGYQHDPNATVWKDLIGLRNLTLIGGVWETNGLSTNAKRIVSQPGGWTDPTEIGSVEAVVTPVLIPNTSTNTLIFASGITFYYGGYNQVTRSIHIRNNESAIYGSARSMFPVDMPTERFSVTALYDDTKIDDCLAVLLNGGSVPYKSVTGVGAAITPGTMYIGTDGTSIVNHCIRVYSKALKDDEIAANYAIDKARFGLI